LAWLGFSLAWFGLASAWQQVFKNKHRRLHIEDFQGQDAFISQSHGSRSHGSLASL